MRYHFNQISTNALATHRRIVEKLFASTLLEVTSVSVSLGTNTTTLWKLVKVSIKSHDNINLFCEESFSPSLYCGIRWQVTVRFIGFSSDYVDAWHSKLIFKFHLEKVLKRPKWREVCHLWNGFTIMRAYNQNVCKFTNKTFFSVKTLCSNDPTVELLQKPSPWEQTKVPVVGRCPLWEGVAVTCCLF